MLLHFVLYFLLLHYMCILCPSMHTHIHWAFKTYQNVNSIIHSTHSQTWHTHSWRSVVMTITECKTVIATRTTRIIIHTHVVMSYQTCIGNVWMPKWVTKPQNVKSYTFQAHDWELEHVIELKRKRSPQWIIQLICNQLWEMGLFMTFYLL